MKSARVILVLLVLSMPGVVAADMPPLRDQGAIITTDLRLLLNSFAALAEGHIERVLHGLKVISVTEEAQSGEWERMQPALSAFAGSGIKQAAVWFVRPNGSYYTLEKGLTGQNLRDRGYFPRLMAGEEVTGALVISNSTGKRSAVVAVPVKKNGKIIGALGASLALDEMSKMLDEKMGLPEGIFFYALDQKGQTCLHRTSALLFAYPSDMGSKSLAKTVGEMLSRPEGAVTYDFYGERAVVYKKLPLTGWVYAVGVVTGRPGTGTELPPVLSELEKAISAELNKVDQDIAKLAGSLSERNLSISETRKMLADLCRSYSYAVDCTVVDRNGRMLTVEPGTYSQYEGSDISAQEQVIRLQKTNKAVLSKVFRSVEGFDAVDLEHPVFSPKGDFAGSVSVLIMPESLLAYVLTPLLQGVPVEAFVMQTDGRILYDQDKEEIGRMLFEDPAYKSFSQLIAVGTMACREKKGAGSYDYRQAGTEKTVKKDAHWTTVGLHGTEWRLVVMHIRPGQATSFREEMARPGAESNAEALKTLANNTEMKKACSRNDNAKVREIFRKFYSEHPGLYSVQWLDSGGTNRYGYPEENSLINFDMKTSRADSAAPMLKALSDKKESSFDCPLLEGETGTFFMVPVYEGEEYLGMVYTIRLKEQSE